MIKQEIRAKITNLLKESKITISTYKGTVIVYAPIDKKGNMQGMIVYSDSNVRDDVANGLIKIAPSSGFKKVKTVKGVTTWTDKNVKNKTRYYYKIRAKTKFTNFEAGPTFGGKVK